jgi:hypothetical protein
MGVKEEHGAREVIAEALLMEWGFPKPQNLEPRVVSMPLADARMEYMPVAEEIVAALWDCGYRIVKVEI